MNRDNPAQRWLVWPVALMVLLPPLLIGLLHEAFGLLPVLSGDRAQTLWPWLILLLLYPLPLVVALRYRRVLLSGVLLAVLQFGQFVAAASLPELPKQVLVTFGNHNSESGIEVICNDVVLGTTPFTMSAEEFRAKVPEWTQPPPQPRVSYLADQNGQPHQGEQQTWWRWTWTPGDPFAWPIDHSRMSAAHDEAKLRELIRTERYWWKFTKSGCLALRSMHAFGGGGGGGRIIHLQTSPGLTVPAERQMRDLLLAGLRAADYQPSAAWTAFLLKYRNILLDDLIQESQSNARLLAVLDRMADDRFGLPTEPDLDASRAALDRAFENVSHPEHGRDDWFAGRVARRVVQRRPHLLVERLWRELGASPGDWERNYESPVRGRRELLLDLIAEFPPREAFDVLVYLHGLHESQSHARSDARLMIAIGNSGRPEAVPIIRVWLDRLWKNSGSDRFVHDHDREETVKAMSRIFIPELEDHFRYLVGHQIKPDHFNMYGPLPEFIRSRIQRGERLDQVTGWIVGIESLTDEQKARLLAEIPHAEAGRWLAAIADRIGDYKRDELMDEVSRMPVNPHHAEFFMKTWLRAHRLQPGHFRSHWSEAILRLDTPDVRPFILERLKAPDASREQPFSEWRKLMERDRYPQSGSLAHLNWLVPELKALPATGQKRDVCLRLLRDIGTEESLALLREWADDPKSGVSSRAKHVLAEPERGAAGNTGFSEEQQTQLRDLLAGRIRPDDLLKPFPSARWTGTNYEPVPVR